jgi:hypothetical protein
MSQEEEVVSLTEEESVEEFTEEVVSEEVTEEEAEAVQEVAAADESSESEEE